VGEQRGLVSVGSHSLCLYTYGPDRKDGEPAALIIPGLGGTAREWAAGRRMMSSFIRTYLYDRSGYGDSEPSPERPTSTNIAAEMDLLLRNANIKPPFILIGHSWGGILAREFITLHPESVAGLVLVDANQEHTLERLDWTNPVLWAVTEGLDDQEVIGLTREHKLTREEWRAYEDERKDSKYKEQAAAEVAEYRSSFPILGSKSQLHRTPPFLGNTPVSVVKGSSMRDFARRYNAGVEAGNGTEDEREAFDQILLTWEEEDSRLQMESLTLSSRVQLLHAGESGHSVHMTQPEVVAKGVKWVLNQWLGKEPPGHIFR